MKTVTNEQELQSIDAKIPTLARQAFSKAYSNALETHGHLLIVKDGLLGECNVDGGFRVVRRLKPPVPIATGTIRTRAKTSDE